jgi:hypothetical protein
VASFFNILSHLINVLTILHPQGGSGSTCVALQGNKHCKKNTVLISTTFGVRLTIFHAFTLLFIILLSRIYYVQLQGFSIGMTEGLSPQSPLQFPRLGRGNSTNDEVAADVRISAAVTALPWWGLRTSTDTRSSRVPTAILKCLGPRSTARYGPL